MFFTIENDFAIIRLRKKTKIIRLIKNIRYKIYGIEAKIKGIRTLFNAHVPSFAKYNISLYESLVSSEYFGRIALDSDTQEDIYYIKRAFERSSAYEITQKCVKLSFLKEYDRSF
jgi:hypothetical protein